MRDTALLHSALSMVPRGVGSLGTEKQTESKPENSLTPKPFRQAGKSGVAHSLND